MAASKGKLSIFLDIFVTGFAGLHCLSDFFKSGESELDLSV